MDLLETHFSLVKNPWFKKLVSLQIVFTTIKKERREGGKKGRREGGSEERRKGGREVSKQKPNMKHAGAPHA